MSDEKTTRSARGAAPSKASRAKPAPAAETATPVKPATARKTAAAGKAAAAAPAAKPTKTPRAAKTVDASEASEASQMLAERASAQKRPPGFRLVQRINFEMARRGISQYAQVASEMGFIDDERGQYLSRLQYGHRSWNSASLERLRMVAVWLELAPLEVFMLADVVTDDDALVETPASGELDRLLGRITLDQEYGNLLPHYADLSVLPPWAKVMLLMLYDDVNRFRLKESGKDAGIPVQGLLTLARRLPK